MILYVIKSSVVLGISLLCYYLFFRKDKRFLFNRAFLLVTLALSLLYPFLSFEILLGQSHIDNIHLVRIGERLTLTSMDPVIEKDSVNTNSNEWDLGRILWPAYFLGVAILALRFFRNGWNLWELVKDSEHLLYRDHRLILVNREIDPFSFGKYVFVNHSHFRQGWIGDEILQHEQVHVDHYHSLDLLILEFLLLLYWFNPLFWIYRATMKANHEYTADFEVLKHTDRQRYCHVLVDHLTAKHYSVLGSKFNHFLTKNRILMMHRIKKPRFNFWGGILLSSLVVFTTMLVLSCTHDRSSLSAIDLDGHPKACNNPNSFSVMVDAGHGGVDDGGTHHHALEKDIVLGIAHAMRQLEVVPDIQLSFTRTGDQTLSLRERVELANGSRPDLFLSLHVNSHPNKEPLGLEVYYAELNRDYRMSLAYSREFANTLGMKPTAIKSADFLVLKETDCPAVLLNIGSMDNAGELAYLMKKENQQKIAREIVDTIVGISKMI